MKLDAQNYTVREPGKLGPVALTLGLLGIALSAAGYFADTKQFFFSYLVAFAFWTSIGLGGLFFTMLHHLVNAQWSTVIRRWCEAAMMTLPVMALFAIPVLLGMKELYAWSNPEIIAADELLHAKAAYLNVPFFIIRQIAYFAIWSGLAILLNRASLNQNDQPSAELSVRLRKISAPGMILFAVTSTFAAFDWLMSLDAHWYSAIYGVYFFSGSALAILSFMILIGLHQRQRGILTREVTVEHYHDLGKLLFGFVVFWAYMAFSQYMLIWYANIPEETVWFYHRWYNDWKPVSLVLIFGHFALPFLALITRSAKRRFALLGTLSVWLLLMRFIDLHWLAMPTLYAHGPRWSWQDAATIVGLGGVFVWYYWRQYTAHPVVPVGDPTLANSMKFLNT